MPPTGTTTAPCPPPCVNAGVKYLLSDPRNKATYQFDNQNFARVYAAVNVYVIGRLNGTSGTIHVENIIPDLPPIVRRAKTVSIVCDACPRGMAKARPAALEQLTVWKRYKVVPDPKSADLIFLFSANRYLGDYLTRDGPDPRPVHIDITYMNVVDPRSGQNLWGDYERLGSWFVGSATKDLIDEFRELLEADDSPAERQLFMKRYRIPKAPTDTGK